MGKGGCRLTHDIDTSYEMQLRLTILYTQAFACGKLQIVSRDNIGGLD